jgi:hypothetical protein
MPTFADKGCHVFSVTNPYCRNLGFLDRSRYFFFQVAPQLYSRGWVNPVPDPLLLRKSGCAGNRTRTSGSVARKAYVIPEYPRWCVWSSWDVQRTNNQTRDTLGGAEEKPEKVVLQTSESSFKARTFRIRIRRNKHSILGLGGIMNYYYWLF